MLGSATFSGKCTNNAISITIDGTLMAPSDYRVTERPVTGYTSRMWTGFPFAEGCLMAKALLCGIARIQARIIALPEPSNSKNIIIGGLTSINSQMFHIVFDGCQNVKVQGVKIMADGNSPNTDGIHVQMSSHVTILNSKIRTGDDCISIGPGTSNLWIENIACGPGHGISIGSLGWELNEPGVQNVTVKTVTFTGTQNGVRIKSWGRPSNGFVRNVHFQDAIMVNVQNPIIIDQNYCPDDKGCPGQASGIKISDVTYQDFMEHLQPKLL
ncbi:Pectin lyase fold/virulence factor [Sesbania bispinosa]|nr:Pectin lyase fold/virulence factor [Sesbania bispinosa]